MKDFKKFRATQFKKILSPRDLKILKKALKYKEIENFNN
jgi:hypothetical protein